MGRRTLLLLFGFAVGLFSACTPTTTPFLPGTELASSFDLSLNQDGAVRELSQAVEAAPIRELPHAVEAAPTFYSPVRHQQIQEQTLIVPISTGSIDIGIETSDPLTTVHKPEASSENSAEEREQLVKPKEEARKRAAPSSSAHADDRLLELVQKDLDKAVELSKERRRLQFSKAVIQHPRVRHYIHQFSKIQKEYLAKTLERSGRYFQMIANALHEEGLPEELGYLALVESNFFPEATSRAGAVGLWQFVPATARQYGLRIDPWIDERRDPVKSTRAAAAYLKDLHDYFGRWYLATAAYNAGQGAIDRALQKSGANDYWSLSQKNHLSEETRNFVPKFVAVTLIATNLEKYGFADLVYETPLEYEEVEINRPLKLAHIAEMAESDIETIRELNPALLRNTTPPDPISFRLRLPAGRGLIFANAYEHGEKETEQIQVVTHQVRKGDTLVSIARRYGQEVRALMRLNGLATPRVRIGQQLMIIVERLRGGLR
jgi:nucleoid-associated protein YgaU